MTAPVETAVPQGSAVPLETPVEAAAVVATPASQVVEQDLLVEDVSIDGMCGVY